MTYPMMLAVFVIKSFGVKATRGNLLHDILWVLEKVPELRGRICTTRKATRTSNDRDWLWYRTDIGFRITTHDSDLKELDQGPLGFRNLEDLGFLVFQIR